MDPLTHTLLGSQLSASGLGRTSGLATATLLVAVNLPDVDFVTYFINPDLALEVRRGITHGVVAMVFLPPLLTLAVWLVHLLRQRLRPGVDRPPVRPLVLLALAYVGVWSHPILDWLNTYGVQLLAPRKDRWFYGDTLFIVDPWIWLILGAAAWLRYGQSTRGKRLCLALTLPMTAVILLGSPSAVGSGIWIVGLLAALMAIRHEGLRAWAADGRLAIGGILLCATYVVLLMAGDRLAEQEVRQQLAQRKTPISSMMVGPTPINPLRRDVIVRSGDRYTFGVFDWLSRPRFHITEDDVPLPSPRPEVAAALAAPCVRGMVGWMRYPIVLVDEADPGFDVHLLDARYARRRQQGFGAARVHLDADLTPACQVR